MKTLMIVIIAGAVAGGTAIAAHAQAPYGPQTWYRGPGMGQMQMVGQAPTTGQTPRADQAPRARGAYPARPWTRGQGRGWGGWGGWGNQNSWGNWHGGRPAARYGRAGGYSSCCW